AEHVAVRAGAAKNAAPGRCTGAVDAEKRPNSWLIRGGPRMELREKRLATAPWSSPCASAVTRCDMRALVVGMTVAPKNHVSNQASIIQLAVAVPYPT